MVVSHKAAALSVLLLTLSWQAVFPIFAPFSPLPAAGVGGFGTQGFVVQSPLTFPQPVGSARPGNGASGATAPGMRPRATGPVSTSSSRIRVDGGCGTASSSVRTQGVQTRGGVDFCTAPIGQSLRNFIFSGDIQGTAQTLVNSNDRNGLAAGLTVPPGVKLSRSPVQRDKDPDVIAAKGIARAALTDGSTPQINKYVDVMLKAALPKELQNFDANTQKLVNIGDCSLQLSSVSQGQQVAVQQNKDCEQVLVKPFEMQQDLLATLSNPAALRFILSADPDTTARRRTLMCTNCQPVRSIPCAFCWPQNLCKDVYWCKNPRRGR